MGRTFGSVRQGVKETAERWERAIRAFRKEDQASARKVVEMAKKHESESLYGFDDPAEAAVFSVLVEIVKEQQKDDVDP